MVHLIIGIISWEVHWTHTPMCDKYCIPSQVERNIEKERMTETESIQGFEGIGGRSWTPKVQIKMGSLLFRERVSLKRGLSVEMEESKEQIVVFIYLFIWLLDVRTKWQTTTITVDQK